MEAGTPTPPAQAWVPRTRPGSNGLPPSPYDGQDAPLPGRCALGGLTGIVVGADPESDGVLHLRQHPLMPGDRLSLRFSFGQPSVDSFAAASLRDAIYVRCNLLTKAERTICRGNPATEVVGLPPGDGQRPHGST